VSVPVASVSFQLSVEKRGHRGLGGHRGGLGTSGEEAPVNGVASVGEAGEPGKASHRGHRGGFGLAVKRPGERRGFSAGSRQTGESIAQRSQRPQRRIRISGEETR
jgi:hypothetical protein